MIRILILLILAQLKKFFRQPAVLFWAIIFPIAMAWILGIAFNNRKEPVYRVGVIGDRPDSLSKLPHITLISTTESQLPKDLREGQFSIYISQENDQLFYHFDPMNSEAKSAYLTIEKGIADSKGGSGIKPIIITRQGSRYIDFLLPGLAALSIMNSALWGIGWGLIEMRMKKMLRRIMATPLSKVTFVLSLFSTRLIVSAIELALLYGFAHAYFGITIQGSLWGLAAIFVAGNFAFCGIALNVGSRTDSTTVGNGLINFVTLPMTILSGIFFSYRNFPDWAVSIIQYLPLTLASDSLRLLFNEAASFADVALPCAILAVIGVVTIGTGIRLFKWH
ncbi:ABC transporter permease [bacterium]|nr:ABC transporter permease [bacterium]